MIRKDIIRFFIFYSTTTSNKDDKKTAITKLKNLIHPILVRKSYLYRGIPPLIKTNKAINNINFKAIIIAVIEVYFKINEGHILKQKSVT